MDTPGSRVELMPGDKEWPMTDDEMDDPDDPIERWDWHGADRFR